MNEVKMIKYLKIIKNNFGNMIKAIKYDFFLIKWQEVPNLYICPLCQRDLAIKNNYGNENDGFRIWIECSAYSENYSDLSDKSICHFKTEDIYISIKNFKRRH
jgi:hypothetical protein